MERPLVAILSHAGFQAMLPPDRYETVRLGTNLAGLADLNPDLVLIGFEDPKEALALAERVQHDHPAAVVLLSGPTLDPATIMRAMRAGVREVLSSPGPAELEDALERAWSVRQRLKESQTGPLTRPLGKVIAIHSPKGGSGKSSVAVNLACALREAQGGSVALLDLSLHGGDLDLILNVKAHTTWADLAQSGPFGIDEIESALAPCPNGLKLLAAPVLSEDAELVDYRALERAVTLLRERYAFIVLDTASVLNETIFKAMELADRIVMPLPLTLPALRLGQKSLKLWSQLGIPASRVSIAAWDQNGDLGFEEAEKVLQAPITIQLPAISKSIEQALNAGEPLFLSQPRSAFSKAIADLAQRINAGPTPAKPEKGKLQGLLKQLSQHVRRQNDVSTQQA